MVGGYDTHYWWKSNLKKDELIVTETNAIGRYYFLILNKFSITKLLLSALPNHNLWRKYWHMTQWNFFQYRICIPFQLRHAALNLHNSSSYLRASLSLSQVGWHSNRVRNNSNIRVIVVSGLKIVDKNCQQTEIIAGNLNYCRKLEIKFKL